MTTKYFTVALLAFSLLQKLFARFLIKKKKKNRDKRVFFLPELRESVRYAGYAEFLCGTAVLSHRSPCAPIPRVPPNVLGMDEGSRTKDERKKKSVRKARGDRSITNHYGPSGTAKRTSTTIRRVFLFRNTRL